MARVTKSASRVRVDLEQAEAELLRDLTGQMESLLRDQDEQDTVNRRLFPDAYEEEADERAFRELVGDELTEGKIAAVQQVREQLGATGGVEVELEDGSVDAWLACLTDMRLALGTRLEITEEVMQADIDPDDPAAGGLAVLHWLGWIQGSVLEALGWTGHPEFFEGA